MVFPFERAKHTTRVPLRPFLCLCNTTSSLKNFRNFFFVFVLIKCANENFSLVISDETTKRNETPVLVIKLPRTTIAVELIQLHKLKE
jgi:hypothetical protein